MIEHHGNCQAGGFLLGQIFLALHSVVRVTGGFVAEGIGLSREPPALGLGSANDDSRIKPLSVTIERLNGICKYILLTTLNIC